MLKALLIFCFQEVRQMLGNLNKLETFTSNLGREFLPQLLGNNVDKLRYLDLNGPSFWPNNFQYANLTELNLGRFTIGRIGARISQPIPTLRKLQIISSSVTGHL